MRNRSGMTLIELLVVMFILSILVGGIAAMALRSSGEGPKKAALADIHLLSIALDAYKLDLRSYPPDTGAGLDPDSPPIDCPYDPGSLWRYLVKPVYDVRRQRMFGPYLEWDNERLVKYNDGREDGPYKGQSYYLTDPWGNPYHYTGDRKRVLHCQGSFDIFSMGPDGVTAYNNEIDDYADGSAADGVTDCPSDDPKSVSPLDNRAYNGEDDDDNGFADDANEYGPEAMLNGDVGDDINNWSGQ